MNGWFLVYVSVPYVFDTHPDTGKDVVATDRIYQMPDGRFEIGMDAEAYGGYLVWRQVDTFEKAMSLCQI